VSRPRLTLILAGAALACWAGYRDAVVGPVVRPLEALTARATAGLVRGAGMEALTAGTVVFHPAGFAFEISRGCMGLVPLAMLAAGILAYPAPGRKKLWGLLAGLPALATLNLLRLAQLFVTGVRWPRAFDVAHEVVWQAIVGLATLGIWLAWVRWADRSAVPLRAPAGRERARATAARRRGRG
jgi:exosortase H (IPTLxxWG-CTERM-specific)